MISKGLKKEGPQGVSLIQVSTSDKSWVQGKWRSMNNFFKCPLTIPFIFPTFPEDWANKEYVNSLLLLEWRRQFGSS
jgi:hypothetical protein